MNRLIPILLLLLLMTACAPDPRKEAEAYATRSQADQAAAAAEQQRQFAQEQHAYDMAKAEQAKQVYTATLQTARLVANVAVGFAGLVLVGCLCALLISSTWTLNRTVQGVGQALIRAADVRANLIQRDRVTGLFPGFLYYDGKGRYKALSFDTHAVIELDSRNEADRQLIANMGAVQIVSTLAAHAEKSTDPAGVSIIKAPTIGVTAEMITLAKEMIRKDANE